MPVKERVGIVISTKMEKTIIVKVESRFCHSLYSKIIVKTKKYLVHDELNECRVGDKVVIKETRPLSKRKHWVVTKIISKSTLINLN